MRENTGYPLSDDDNDANPNQMGSVRPQIDNTGRSPSDMPVTVQPEGTDPRGQWDDQSLPPDGLQSPNNTQGDQSSYDSGNDQPSYNPGNDQSLPYNSGNDQSSSNNTQGDQSSSYNTRNDRLSPNNTNRDQP